MKFTSKELASIEQTVGKLADTVAALCDYESTERANMRYLTHIIAELRHCAKAYQTGQESDAADRLIELINVK
jgi:hypothetical protein